MILYVDAHLTERVVVVVVRLAELLGNHFHFTPHSLQANSVRLFSRQEMRDELSVQGEWLESFARSVQAF